MHCGKAIFQCIICDRLTVRKDSLLACSSTGCQEALVSGWLKTYAAASALEEADHFKLLNETVSAAGYQVAFANHSIGEAPLWLTFRYCCLNMQELAWNSYH